MNNEVRVPRQIDEEVRHAALALVHDIARYHPEVMKAQHFPSGKGPVSESCRVCQNVAQMMELLDAEQREYGPPIDVTDPSYIREYGAGR